MALAYLLGKPAAKILKVNLNIPLLMVFSIIPDIDIIFLPTMHRGPTHSLVIAFLVFIPVFIIYRKKAIPYFLALISHSLIADFLISGQLQLFWPLTEQQFGLRELCALRINIEDPINITLELTLFLIATVLMYKTKDIYQFFKANKSNLILIIPIFTVLLPTFMGYPFNEPLLETLTAEAVAHLFYIVLFATAVLVTLEGIFKKRKM